MTTKKVLAISFFILVALLIIGYLAPYIPNYLAQEEYWYQQNADVQKHIKAWAEQKITKYQLSISYMLGCRRKMTIENNMVIEVFEDTCSTSYTNLKTIDDLFVLIDAVVKEKSGIGNDSACYGPSVMDVIYDEQYKIPKTAKQGLYPEEIWRFKTAKIPSCIVYDIVGISWQIDSFIPLD